MNTNVLKQNFKNIVENMNVSTNSENKFAGLSVDKMKEVLNELGYIESEDGFETNGWAIDWWLQFNGVDANIVLHSNVYYDTEITVTMENK